MAGVVCAFSFCRHELVYHVSSEAMSIVDVAHQQSLLFVVMHALLLSAARVPRVPIVSPRDMCEPCVTCVNLRTTVFGTMFTS